jgi:hypothetical protein
MTEVRTQLPRPQNPGGVPPTWRDDSRPGQGKPRPNIPLNRYLNKLLDPTIIVKPPESVQPTPVQEQVEVPAQPAPAVSTWQRAKSSATKTLRAAAARRHSQSDGPSQAMIQPPKAKPVARVKTKAHTSTQAAGNGRQKAMMALIPVLAIALVIVVKNPLKVSPAVPVQNTLPADATPPVVANVDITWEIPALYQPGIRDPMKLPEPPATAAPETTDETEIVPKQTRIELVVSGILYSQDRPAAIIDTQLVHEGQQISGATVKKIEKDSVEFEWNGQTWKQTVDK